jgi:hypothetical protein
MLKSCSVKYPFMQKETTPYSSSQLALTRKRTGDKLENQPIINAQSSTAHSVHPIHSSSPPPTHTHSEPQVLQSFHRTRVKTQPRAAVAVVFENWCGETKFEVVDHFQKNR